MTQELSSMSPNKHYFDAVRVILYHSLSIVIIILALSLPLDQMKGQVGGTRQQPARQPTSLYGSRAFPNSATVTLV